MKRAVIVAMAAAAMVLGLGCARDLARASSGVIGCAPEDIAIDDVSVGWSETSWAASCGGATFRCAGERSPWCAPSMSQPPPGSELEAAADEPAATQTPASAPSPEPPATKAEPTAAELPTDAAPDSGPAELPPGHPIPEGFTDAPH
jgi:hypothetical protein